MFNEALYGRVLNWEELPAEDVRPGVRRRAYSTDSVMFIMNELERGMAENPHIHTEFDQLAYIVEGEAEYFVDGDPKAMGPGSMLLVPAGAEHFIRPLSERVLNLDVFSPPRSDFLHLLHYLGTR